MCRRRSRRPALQGRAEDLVPVTEPRPAELHSAAAAASAVRRRGFVGPIDQVEQDRDREIGVSDLERLKRHDQRGAVHTPAAPMPSRRGVTLDDNGCGSAGAALAGRFVVHGADPLVDRTAEVTDELLPRDAVLAHRRGRTGCRHVRRGWSLFASRRPRRDATSRTENIRCFVISSCDLSKSTSCEKR